MPSSSKRPLSPQYSFTTKRSKPSHHPPSHSQLTASPRRDHPLTLDARSLSDELFIEVLCYLSPWDLSSVERVNRHFMRLANDGILWKRLYLRAHPAPSLRGTRSWPVSRHLSDPALHSHEDRTILPLPSRAGPTNPSDLPIDWKTMFRVSTNWSYGRSTLKPIISSLKPKLPPPPASSQPASLPTAVSPITAFSPTSSLIFFASRLLVPFPQVPSIAVHDSSTSTLSSSPRQTPIITLSSLGLQAERNSNHVRGKVSVVDISVDSSSHETDSTKVYVAYSCGSFSIFTISSISTGESLHTFRETFYQPSPTVPPLHLPVISALYSDLLVTCSSNFVLSFYSLPLPSTLSSDGPITRPTRPFNTLRSYVSWFPASLLITSETNSKTTVSLAYSVPIYPSGFTCSLHTFSLSSSPHLSTYTHSVPYELTSDNHLSALPSVPFASFLPSSPRLSSGISSEVGRYSSMEIGVVDSCTGIAMDERWICMGGGENMVQVFRIGKDGLRFCRTLWCHQGGVTALSCLDGRLISADSTGRIFITELDEPFRPPTSSSSSASPLSQNLSDPTPLSVKPPRSPSPSPRSPLPSNIEVLPPFLHRSRRSSRRTSPAAIEEDSAAWTEEEEEEDEDDARGKESVIWLAQNCTRIVSLSVPRDAGTEGDWADRTKVWAFDS